ncbi:IS66 family insertion sequence element accessory protein TnpB [Dehalobacterium formicoaceticum]|uniref:IS66 family insertion sequence element accessory protein TnpB n=1 Tax=Dehalobacterium formicoaceticum TaxID=51515 RepID=UPI003B831556
MIFCNRKKDRSSQNGVGMDCMAPYTARKGHFQWPDGNSQSLAVSQREFRWLLDGLPLHQASANPEISERIII